MTIDLICMIALAFGFWVGYQRGIIQLAFNLVSYVFGVVLAFKMTPAMTGILEKLFNSTNPMMFFAGFLVNLAILMIIVRYAAKGMESLFQAAYLGTLNQVLGGVAYGGFFILIFSILLWFGRQAAIVTDATLAGSKTIEYLEVMPGQAKGVLIRLQPVFSEIWHTSMTWMDRMKSHTPEAANSEPKIYDIEEDKPTGKPNSRGIEDFPDDLLRKPTKKPEPQKDDGDGIEN